MDRPKLRGNVAKFFRNMLFPLCCQETKLIEKNLCEVITRQKLLSLISESFSIFDFFFDNLSGDKAY